MFTNKSPLYLPWLFIICVSDDIVVTSQVYKFHSHIDVMSQSINKKFGATTPLLLCLQTRKFPTLFKQLWLEPMIALTGLFDMLTVADLPICGACGWVGCLIELHRKPICPESGINTLVFHSCIIYVFIDVYTVG